MQNIIDEIENNYYEIPDQADQTAMEIVLDKINQEACPWCNRIFLCIALSGQSGKTTLFLVSTASANGLFYKTKTDFIKKWIWLSRTKWANKMTKNQLFSQICAG